MTRGAGPGQAVPAEGTPPSGKGPGGGAALPRAA